MDYCCFFDQFPVEILHNIFSYFWAHEILFSFLNVSDYIDAILRSYTTFLMNFKSLGLCQIDFICRHIQADQIFSLTFSNEISAIGQYDLFFSYFDIEQLTRLRSLILINITIDSFELILPKLNNLTQLHSISFIDIEQNQILLNNCSRLIVQLNRLNLPNLKDLTLKSFSNLHHLKLGECSIKEFQIICSDTTQLQSLDIYLLDSANIDCLSSLIQLTRLALKFNGKQMNRLKKKIMYFFFLRIYQ
jgi:hypothetical protein